MAAITIEERWSEAADTPLSVTAHWVGEPGERAVIDTYHCARFGVKPQYKPGEVLTLGGLRLRVVSNYGYAIRGHEVMLDGWRARLQASLIPLREGIDLFYRKTILTLAIWGLATRVAGEYPHWGWVVRRWSGKRAH